MEELATEGGLREQLAAARIEAGAAAAAAEGDGEAAVEGDGEAAAEAAAAEAEAEAEAEAGGEVLRGRVEALEAQLVLGARLATPDQVAEPLFYPYP